MKILICLSIIVLPFIVHSQVRTGYCHVTDAGGTGVPNAIIDIIPVSDTTTVYQYICDKNGNITYHITESDSIYFFRVSPSVQTMQFFEKTDTLNLIDGDNGISFISVQYTNSNGLVITVNDTSGNPIENAIVKLYDTERKWRIDSCYISKPFYTGPDGKIIINSLLPVKYWFNIRSGYLTNRFTVKNTTAAIDTAAFTEITVPIKDLSEKGFYMCGLCDNKVWITDSLVVFGVSQQYSADTRMLSDGTWSDSNGNHGYWWFSPNEAKMAYNYDPDSPNGGGSTVQATLIELTDSSFVGDMTMLGLPVRYFMSDIPYDINLNIMAKDTILYLNNYGTAILKAEDILYNSTYSFNSTMTLSKELYSYADEGVNTVYITMTDRCGNYYSDTINVTVINSAGIGINEKDIPKIYPNPADGMIFIENIEQIDLFELTDMYGKVLIRQESINESVSLDISHLKKGLYIANIKSKNWNYISKIIKD